MILSELVEDLCQRKDNEIYYVVSEYRYKKIAYPFPIENILKRKRDMRNQREATRKRIPCRHPSIKEPTLGNVKIAATVSLSSEIPWILPHAR